MTLEMGKIGLGRLRLLSMGLCAFLISVASPISAQLTLKLPADIIFETWTQISYPFLVRLDAHTLKWSLFYAKKNSDVHLIGWSPKGDLLAIFQDQGHLCILSRAGKLISCMENRVGDIADSGNGAGGNAYDYTIAWSDDESKLYYVTDMPDTGSSPALLEADIATGKTLRVMYDQPDMDPYSAIPAPNGSALLMRYHSSLNQVNLIQFSTTDHNAVPAVVRKNLNAQFVLPAGYDATAPQNQEDKPTDHQRGFCGFSPKSNYLSVQDTGAITQKHIWPYEFDILTVSGDLKYRVRYETNPIVPTACPSWSTDETLLYFRYIIRDENQVDYALIYKYTPSIGKIEPYFTKPYTLSEYASPLEVSPDGNYLLYEDAGGADGGTLTTTVVGPNNTVATYPGIFGDSKHPLWVPPVQP